jgi:hypothetical protein
MSHAVADYPGGGILLTDLCWIPDWIVKFQKWVGLVVRAKVREKMPRVCVCVCVRVCARARGERARKLVSCLNNYCRLNSKNGVCS